MDLATTITRKRKESKGEEGGGKPTYMPWVPRLSQIVIYPELLILYCVGEIVISGGFVGGGYFADQATTEAAYVLAPGWMREMESNVSSYNMLYRSGDLARYNTDRTFQIIGRRDTQVKLRGFRIELGEIENQTIATGMVTAALAALPMAGPCARQIVAVVCFTKPDLKSYSGVEIFASGEGRAVLEGLKAPLSLSLPEYMIPSVWVILEKIPDDIWIQVMAPCRVDPIRTTIEAARGATKIIVHIHLSTSACFREVVFNMTEQETIDIAVRCAHLIRTFTKDSTDSELRKTKWTVEFTPENFQDTSPEFAVRICEAVKAAWDPTKENQIIFNIAATVEDASYWISGELLVSGYLIFKGYYKNKEKTDETLVRDHRGRIWLRTGDIVFMDVAGRCTITGRVEYMIKRGRFIPMRSV